MVMVDTAAMVAEWLEPQLLVWPWALSPGAREDRTNIIKSMHTHGLNTTLRQREVISLVKDVTPIERIASSEARPPAFRIT